jgi:hypothetical protein
MDLADGVDTVNIMLPTNERISFGVAPTMTVSDLADFVSRDPRDFVPPNRAVVFIYHGRILQPTQIVRELDTITGFTVHALFRSAHRPLPPQLSAGSEVRGFDRLSRMNYTPAQIAQFRRNFHIMRGTVNAPQPAQLDEEEEWFPVIFIDENPVRNPRRAAPLPAFFQDVDEEYMAERHQWVKVALGIFLGLTFGIWSGVFMVMPRSDRMFFMGLLIGTGANFMMKRVMRLLQ